MKDKNMFKRLISYMRPHWASYLVAILLMGIVVLLDILNPYIISLSLKEIGNDSINFSRVIYLFIIGVI